MDKYVNKEYLIRVNKNNNFQTVDDLIISLSDTVGTLKVIDGMTYELMKASKGNFIIKPIGYITDDGEFELTGFSIDF